MEATLTKTVNNDIAEEDAIIDEALAILRRRIKQPGRMLQSSQEAKDYLRLALGQHKHEVFGLLLMDPAGNVIDVKDMFRGTITEVHTFPREIVKTCLDANAAYVVLYHNHPTNSAKPSDADISMTKTVTEALRYVSIDVLDHFIITADEIRSLYDMGLVPRKRGPAQDLIDMLTKAIGKPDANQRVKKEEMAVKD